MTKTAASESLRKRERTTNRHQFFHKNSFRFVFFFFLISGSFLFVGVGKASAATVYVSNSTTNGYTGGSDGNTYVQAQSKSTPWLTVTYAVQHCSNGDTIVINDGTYVEAGIITPSKTGLTINSQTDYGARIQIASGSRVFSLGVWPITFGKIWIDCNSSQSYGIMSGTAGINITLNGTKITNYTLAGLYLYKAMTLVASGVNVSSSVSTAQMGFYLNPDTDSTVSIVNSTISQTSNAVTQYLIYFVPQASTNGSSLTVTGNAFLASPGGSVSSVHGVTPTGTKTILVANNTYNYTGLVSTTSADIFYMVNSATIPVTSVQIYNNSGNLSAINGYAAAIGDENLPATPNNISGVSIHNNDISNVGEGIFLGFITGAQVYDNVVTGAWMAFTIKQAIGCSIYDNIINSLNTSDSGKGVYSKGGSNNAYYNNTIYMGSNANSNTTGIYIGANGAVNASNELVRNNIVYGSTSLYLAHVDTSSTATLSNNLYFTTGSYTLAFSYGTTHYSTLPAWQAIGYDSSSKVVNPIFTNGSGSYSTSTDFTLQSSSPAIEAGTPVGLTTDYAGNPIYGAPDIGAYEHQPPYTQAANKPPTTGSFRLFANGQYEMTSASSTSAIAHFSVTPVGGFYSASTSEYMDLSLNTWTTADKNWTASSTSGAYFTHATSTVYTIGDLTPNNAYTFRLDSSPSTALTSTQCSGSLCTADGTGTIVLTYTGGYSSHTFDLQALPVISSVSTITTPSTNKTPSFSFTSSEAGTLLYAGACTPSSTSVSSGSNTFTFSSLADGTYSNCAFSVIDAADNDSATTTLNSFLIDTTGPTGSITNASGSPTNQTTPTLNLTIADAGVGTTGAQMRLSCNGSTWSSWSAYTTPVTTFNIDTGAGCSNSDGTKTVYVEYEDSLLNIGSAYNTGPFTLDTTNPNAALSNTPATYGSYTSSTAASITVAGTDVVNYEYKLDSGSYSASTPVATPITLSGLSEGSHTISVIGETPSGTWQSTSAPTTYSWTVDLTGPVFSSAFTPANNGTMERDNSFSWSATDAASGVGTYNFYLDGSLATSGLTTASYTPASNLTCGSHTWYIRAFDNLLNHTDSSTLSMSVACGGARTTSYTWTPIINNVPAWNPMFATTTASTTTPPTASSTPSTTAPTPSSSSSGLSPTEIQSILSLLSSFGADNATIANVQAALGGTTANNPPATSPQTTYTFTRNLSLHSTGPDVKALQQFLNSHGFTVASTGPGSAGQETTRFGIATYRALIKFQKANHITPASGFFGPLTRGKIAGTE